MFANLDPFMLYNLLVGAIASIGILYLFYKQRAIMERRFLYFLGVGLLIFAIGSPIVDFVAPNWSHLVHGIAALFVVFSLYNPVHNDLRTGEWVELLFQDPAHVRRPREWMRPIDERILELFRSSDLVLPPAIIAYNIDYSTKEVNRRLSELVEHGFVEKVERGKYRMTDMGERYLRGELQKR
ncbi:MAG: ArsR family transcriptional regulator [Halobacteriaceae archaeon]